MTGRFRSLVVAIVIACSSLIVVSGCDDAGPPGLDGGIDAPAGDLYAGEGPVTQPVVDMFVPLDQSADLDPSDSTAAADQ